MEKHGQTLIDAILDRFSYNPRNGKVYARYKYSNNSPEPNEEVGSLNGKGYLQVQVLGTKMELHRVCWVLMHGSFPDGVIDHIDGDILNNSERNLRCVSQLDNTKNSSIRSDNKSSVTGVCKPKKSGKWLAQISINGKQTHLGYFKHFQQAVAARKEAEERNGYHRNHGKSKKS